MKTWKVILSVFVLLIIAGILVVSSFITTNFYNYKTVGNIPAPIGYERVSVKSDSYGAYLRALPLKKRGERVRNNKSGYLWKYNLIASAVVDKPCIRRSEDCADVCYHLYAEYLFTQGRYSDICFKNHSGQKLCYSGGASNDKFLKYMNQVFDGCSTYSIAHFVNRVDITDIQIGDVFCFPARGNKMGHAATVVDMAVNKKTGKKAVLIVEGNYPGVSIHLVRNPNLFHGAWFYIDDNAKVLKIGLFKFKSIHLYRFQYVHPITISPKQEDKIHHAKDVAKSIFTHTAPFGPITNTIVDLVGATTNRYIYSPINNILGTNFQSEKRTNTELDVFPSDAIFLQEAARRAESDIPEFKNGRAQFFEKNPDAKITYHFVGKVDKSGKKFETYPYNRSQSGYQKFFYIPYGGVMQHGVYKSLTAPNARMQNALGGFNITYTKDGIQITDDWNYHSGAGNTTSLGGVIKTIGEILGTHKQNGDPLVVTSDIRLPYLTDDRYKDVDFMNFSDLFTK